MLTKKQEQTIRNAANIEWIVGDCSRTKKGVIECIVAAIKAYDEQVNGKIAVTEVPETEPHNDSLVVFRPDHLRGAELWVFNSLEEMTEKLFKFYNSQKYEGEIMINRDVLQMSALEHAQEVYLVDVRTKSAPLVLDCIGLCDCMSFKKGVPK